MELNQLKEVNYRFIKINETREVAIDNLIINATKDYKEFDAIINIRMSTSDVAGGASEVMVYGTVIKFIDMYYQES